MSIGFLKYAGIAALYLTISSCSDDSDIIDMGPGSFEIVITGDVEAEYGGFAFFSEYADLVTGKLFFAMTLMSNEGEEFKIWFVRSGQFPGNDTYIISPFASEDMDDVGWIFGTEEFVSIFMRQADLKQAVFYSDSGTITLQLTTDNTMYGDFELAATGFPRYRGPEETETGEMEVHLSGRFNALFGEIQLPVF